MGKKGRKGGGEKEGRKGGGERKREGKEGGEKEGRKGGGRARETESVVLIFFFFPHPLTDYTGTRYKRRGVDAEGHVANYVETEMLVQCGIHVVSYVIVRGSVPVYWTQPGYKYRPLPIIERGAGS